jgi:hypothetical protein
VYSVDLFEVNIGSEIILGRCNVLYCSAIVAKSGLLKFIYIIKNQRLKSNTYTASRLCRVSIMRQICLSARSIRSFQIESTTLLLLTASVVMFLIITQFPLAFL